MTFSVVPLDAPLGAKIRGLDLRREIDADTSAALSAAWHRYQVLLLRDQHLSEEQQIRFGRYFGRLWTTGSDPKFRKHVAHPEIILITNKKVNGEFIGVLAEGEMTFHQDNVFREVPAIGTILYAVDIPSHGGETLFSNMYAAYEALPEATKRRLDGVRAHHMYNYGAQSRDTGVTGEERHHGVAGGAFHPAVITHPATRRKALYINRLMTVSLDGMAKKASDALLDELFDHIEKPEFVYEHHWRVGDLVMWDNWCTCHARREFPANQLRLMRRLTVESEAPPPA